MTIFAIELMDNLRNGYLDDHAGDISVTSGYLYKWQDKNSPPLLWSNQQVVRYLNWSIMEIGKRNPIYDSGTTTTVKIPVVSGTSLYNYSPSIMTIEEIKLNSTGRPLTQITRESKEYEVLPVPDYFNDVDWTGESGDVTRYILDTNHRCIRLYKTPSAADSLLLTVQRRFDAMIDWDDIKDESVAITEVSELPDELEDAILLGAASRAFLKRDEDTYDPQAAAFFNSEFDKYVGAPVDWRTLESRRRNANKSFKITPPQYQRAILRRRSYYGETTSDDDL